MGWTVAVQTITAFAVVLVLIAVVVAIVLSARQNERLDATMRALLEHDAALLEAAAQQSEAARALIEETHEDRAVAARPLLILLDEPPAEIRDQPWAAVRVRNVGNGPALNFVVWMIAGGSLYRSAGAEASGFSGALHLAPGDIFEPGPSQNMLYVGPVHGILDPGSAVVADHPSANLIAYCGDHFGNRYRFNLRTADPPDVWERGVDAPAWAGAWDPRLSSREVPAGTAPAYVASLPEPDLTQLVATLRDLLHRLQDAAGADADVHLTGRGAQRTHDPEDPGDFGIRSHMGPRGLG
jgi:hypothetical protein